MKLRNLICKRRKFSEFDEEQSYMGTVEEVRINILGDFEIRDNSSSDVAVAAVVSNNTLRLVYSVSINILK